MQYASIQSLDRQERISSDAEVLWAGLCLADQGRHAHFNQLGGGQPKMVLLPVYTVQPCVLLRGGQAKTYDYPRVQQKLIWDGAGQRWF